MYVRDGFQESFATLQEHQSKSPISHLESGILKSPTDPLSSLKKETQPVMMPVVLLALAHLAAEGDLRGSMRFQDKQLCSAECCILSRSLWLVASGLSSFELIWSHFQGEI